ncbi:hypothetical protein Peur_048146 [Populus x canadensis]
MTGNGGQVMVRLATHGLRKKEEFISNPRHYQLQWLILFSPGSRTGELKERPRKRQGDPGPLRQISNPSLHPMKMKYSSSYFLVSIPTTIQISIYQTLIYDHLQKIKNKILCRGWVGGWLAGFCSGAK